MQTLIEIFDEREYKARFLSYSQRLIDFFKSSLIFYCIIFFLGGLMGGFLASTIALSIFLLINFFEYSSWARFLLTHIKTDEGNLTVEYYDNNSLQVVVDNISSFSFQAKNVWYKIRGGKATYLEIRHNGKIIAKQFEIGDLSEDIIRRIEKSFSQGVHLQSSNKATVYEGN